MLHLHMPAKKYFTEFDRDRHRRYSAAKGAAKQRDVPFLLSFDQWWSIWIQSGHWDERGQHRGTYCMSRYGDLGFYEIGNVFIQETTKNVSQAQKNKIQPQSMKDRLKEVNLHKIMPIDIRKKISQTSKDRCLPYSCLKCHQIFRNQRHFKACKK